MITIKHRITGEVIVAGETYSEIFTVTKNLVGANLGDADFRCHPVSSSPPATAASPSNPHTERTDMLIQYDDYPIAQHWVDHARV